MRLKDARLGLALGFVGITAFSVTFPATRYAVPYFDATFVGIGRALVAALIAATVLALRREPFPRRHALGLLAISSGIVFGYPLFSALALQRVPSSHAAVVAGLLPAGTALFAVLRGGERPRAMFWIANTAGLAAVFLFALASGAGRLQLADSWLLIAVVTASFGYAEGGRIARELGGWRTISWVLVLAAPIALVPVIATWPHTFPREAGPWIAFAYVAIFSQYLGFFAWYRGLALGGIARVGQMALIQPILTMLWAALFAHETISPATTLAALAVIASAAFAVSSRSATAA